MNNQAVIVISGYNIRAVIAFCRWATAHDVNYHVVARSKEDPVFLTDYKGQVAFTRNSPSLRPEQFRSWCDSLNSQYGYQRFIILPSTEYLNRFLLKHRNSIEGKDCIIPLVDERLYRIISDKQSFAKLCESYGLDIPEEFNGIPEKLPFVAKPRTYFSAQGKQLVPQLIINQHDLDKFCDENKDDYFFQNFINGRSLYLLAYIGQNENILYSQENLIQQARGGSVILAKTSNFHHSDIAKKYVRMLREQKYLGLIMVEVRLDESNGKYYMIEANPRLWGPLQFAIDNNIDLFGAMLKDYEFDIPKDTYSHSPHPSTHYFWSGGLTQQSQPFAYHSYSSDELVKDFPNIRHQDIFLRTDTLNLFFKESQIEGNDE